MKDVEIMMILMGNKRSQKSQRNRQKNSLKDKNK